MKKFLSLLLCIMMCISMTPSLAEDVLTYADTIAWDGAYDVVVVGFGGAGVVASKTAADAGASVLLLEKAPEGHEGGNTRYCGQMFVYGSDNYEDTAAYYKALGGLHEVPEDMFEVYVQNIANMDDVVAETLGLNKEDFFHTKPVLPGYNPEYPELPGSESIKLMATHAGTSDGFLWQNMRKLVTDRADKIDVWFESPAMHLIQDPYSKTVVGVQVERNGEMLNIRANNGVILTCGGFEANTEMVETYLDLPAARIFGSEYNTGDGIRMAMEVGADLWHMSVWEGGGAAFTTVGESGSRYTYMTFLYGTSGSVIQVSGKGARYLNDGDAGRHGHISVGGEYLTPKLTDTNFYVMSEEHFNAANGKGWAEDYEYIYKADTLEALAEMTGMDADLLTSSVNDFNRCAEAGIADSFGRQPETMKVFPAEGPYYAVEIMPLILNTQGGARRNVNAEVLDVSGNPIPHLYSAGEFGAITSHMYQGGGNIAETIIFGKIAGENAAAKKEPVPYEIPQKVESTLKYTPGVANDLIKEESAVELNENEYLGKGTGMGGELQAKVTMDNGKIASIEIIKHAESDGISDPAFAQVPDAIIAANSTEVDTASGATITSKAIIEAVNDALSQVK